MNQKQFKYSVLKYRPSYWLDEQVNIGLLFLFEEEGKVEFLYPNQLKRIHNLFPSSKLPNIRAYLKSFKNRANQLSKQELILSPIEKSVLQSDFLIPDANAFFFGPWKTGFYETSSKILEYYHKEYFSTYEDYKKESQRDELWISNQFSSYLKEKSFEKFHLFQKEVSLKNESAHAIFNYSWQNGTLNLVRPLGFDLQTSESILDKSNLWLGKLTCLKSIFEEKNYRVDFVVSEPNAKNSELKQSFDNAVSVLRKLQINKEIIYVQDIPDYLDDALKKVQS